MTRVERLSASLQDYLEAISNIVSSKGGVRAKDIARYLGVKAGSVTTALQALAKTDHIRYQPYEVISLTGKGLQEAKEIIRKHEILRDFFVGILGASPSAAEEGACKMEHVIPDELVEKLIAFTEFIQACPRCSRGWIERFHARCKRRAPDDFRNCASCIGAGIGIETPKKGLRTKTTKPTTLLEVSVGEKCVVKKIRGKTSVVARLVEMGIGHGAVMAVERVAPPGDSVEVKVKGYHLSIRKEEAAEIEVEKR